MTDEHRADVAGFAGNEIVRTPVLDELARTGVVFDNAYATVPLCLPGRQCMAVGKYLCNSGVRPEPGCDLPPESPTFARLFAQYGYRTVCSGKLHHTGWDQNQGWMLRIGVDHYEGNVLLQNIAGKVDSECQRYEPLDSLKSDVKTMQRELICSGAGPTKDKTCMDATLGFIRDNSSPPNCFREQPRRKEPRPLLLKVSLLEPHYPFQAEKDLLDYYLPRVRPYLDQETFPHQFLSGDYILRQGKDVSEQDIRRATAAYYGMVENADANFGRIIDALEFAGHNLDDWIIVYTSDHGEMLGEHSSWEKGQFFEGSVRVPLIVRWPKGFDGGRIISRNVSHCDIFATLCELAGISVPEGLDSRSLVPFLRGDNPDWDNEIISEMIRKKRVLPHGALMIKRDNLKYHYYGPDMPEILWDLEKNPEETVNFIDHPNYVKIVKHFRICRKEFINRL